ncbi:MAG: hypothetical protein KF876_13710 [Nitrospira sp.]|nr:hypothetical protein [Nitrospira sp.]
MARGFRLSMFALASVFLVSCSLLDSWNEGATAEPPTPIDPAIVAVVSKGDYRESCREKGVPIPPDWTASSSEWRGHGNLHTILLTPNSLDQTPVDNTSFATVWSYASPDVRGACIALGRSSGTFQVICQSATTGHACFWSNDPSSPSTSWNPETTEVPIASLRDPVQGFAPDTVDCTECHRGNNAFLYAPDDPTWATVLRPERPRPNFTTRVEQSPHHGQLTFGSTTMTYPRFIPIGGTAMALTNPLPPGPACSGSCHELHGAILQKNHTAEGYVKVPRPMGPQCATNSPDDDPTRNCYQR